MKMIKVLIIASLIFINTNPAIATTEVETKEELLNYIRTLFSDTKVIETYHKLISEGYSWQDEYGNFGSMVDEKRESFYGQIQIVMVKNKGAKRRPGEGFSDHGRVILDNGKRVKEDRSSASTKVRVLLIDFLWSRKDNKLENIKVGTYSR